MLLSTSTCTCRSLMIQHIRVFLLVLMFMRFCRSEPFALRVKPGKGIVPFYAAEQGG